MCWGRLKTVEVYERNDEPLGTESTSYQYDPVGNLDEQANPNGIVTDYEYNELNRLSKLTHYYPDQTPETLTDNLRLAEYTYTLRADGKRTQAVEKQFEVQNGAEVPISDLLFQWTYDDLGRLTDEVFTDVGDLLAELDDYSATYAYDLAGNRTEKTVDNGNAFSTDETVTYTYDSNDRLLTEELDTTGDGQTEQSITITKLCDESSTNFTAQSLESAKLARPFSKR